MRFALSLIIFALFQSSAFAKSIGDRPEVDPIVRVKADAELMKRSYDGTTMSRLGIDRKRALAMLKPSDPWTVQLNCEGQLYTDIARSSEERVRRDAVSNAITHKKDSPRKFARSERIVICDNLFILDAEQFKIQHQEYFKPAGRTPSAR